MSSPLGARNLNYRILLVPLLPATAIGAICAQAPAVSPSALVDCAGHYVEEYDKAFSALVCEERQIQSLVRPDGRTEKKRELVSDFLLVNAGTERMLAFREVVDVDGKPVRNRQERLRKLFIETPRTALKQAEAIAKEGGRRGNQVQRDFPRPIRGRADAQAARSR